MRNFLRSMVLGLVLVLLLVAQDYAADNKPADKPAPNETGKTEPKNSEKKPANVPAKQYQVVNKIAGKLSKVDSKDRTITIDVQVRQGRSNKTVHEEISMADDVKIRAMKLPERFDDKYQPKPYTPAEKAKLKGDNPKLPGYIAEFSRLAPGQVIEVELSVNKPAPGAKKDKDVVAEKPFATMVLILSEEAKATDKKKNP